MSKFDGRAEAILQELKIILFEKQPNLRFKVNVLSMSFLLIKRTAINSKHMVSDSNLNMFYVENVLEKESKKKHDI